MLLQSSYLLPEPERPPGVTQALLLFPPRHLCRHERGPAGEVHVVTTTCAREGSKYSKLVLYLYIYIFIYI